MWLGAGLTSAKLTLFFRSGTTGWTTNSECLFGAEFSLHRKKITPEPFAGMVNIKQFRQLLNPRVVLESAATIGCTKGTGFQYAGRQLPFDPCGVYVGYCDGMDVERIIDEIEQLQEMFEAPDIRPLSAGDISAANRKHDELLAHSPWFRLWQHFGVCCRPQSPVVSEHPGSHK
jgi:hypothetical protein